MVENASKVVSLITTTSEVSFRDPRNCLLKTGLAPARRNLCADTTGRVKVNFEPVAPDEVGELGSALDVKEAEASLAASSKTSFAPNVNTPVAPAKSETSSDGLLSSSMMLKKTSGGCSEPGSRNCFQFISAKVIRM